MALARAAAVLVVVSVHETASSQVPCMLGALV